MLIGKGGTSKDFSLVPALKAAKVKSINLGTIRATVPAGTTKKITVALDDRGKKLLRKAGHLKVSLQVTETTAGKSSRLLSRSLRFR